MPAERRSNGSSKPAGGCAFATSLVGACLAWVWPATSASANWLSECSVHASSRTYGFPWPWWRRICLRANLWFLHKEIRSEEHTSELQSHSDLVCRLLLEKKQHI